MNFKKLSIICVCTLITSNYYAQSETPLLLGTNNEFLQKIESALTAKTLNRSLNDSIIQLALPKANVINAKVNFREKNSSKGTHLEGEIIGEKKGIFSLEMKENDIKGSVVIPADKKAYVYYSDKTKNAFIKEVDINTIMCIDYDADPNDAIEEKAVDNTNKSTVNAVVDKNVYRYQSLPGARGCLLLDFDGHYLPPGNKWGGNAINARPSGLSSAAIQEAWEIVSEDYRPFNLNVTTDENVYNSYPRNKRMRCVITPTTNGNGGGGVAQIGSFRDNDDNVCWSYLLSPAKTTGEVTSHEFGHTLGLDHDGRGNYQKYYDGHGSWAPIMGNSYVKKVTQWSKGEYSGANNLQDDLAIISGKYNDVGYRQNNIGNTFTNATPINFSSEVKSVIRYSNDVDMFTFNASPNSNFTIKVKTAPRHANLRLKVVLYNQHKVAVAERIASANNLSEELLFNSTGVLGGQYYVEVRGTNDGNGQNGYSNYASIGGYSITVNGTNSRTTFMKKSNEEVTVYPNPVKDELTINTGSEGLTDIEVVNNVGVVIYKTTTSDAIHKVFLGNKPSGTYVVLIKNSETGLQKTFNILKQ